MPALAQQASPAPAPGEAAGASQDREAEAHDIVVTGYKRSLTLSTNAKRESVGFSDSIFAEDIGKFPDTNIAESFNRIPGITISRDFNGAGVNVAIRGLGANFTQVTLNGAPVAVASNGATGAQGTDRSVDLSFFPTELFSKLTVNKSYTADLTEGGAAGNVDIRVAHAFDRPGTHLTYNVLTTKQDQASAFGVRGSLIASTTGEHFGFLLGVAGNRDHSNVRGFETIGWTNPNISAAQCGAGVCNTTGGGNWTIPATVPANAANGLVTGTAIDNAFLLAKNPGLTIQQIDNAILPRLGRPMSLSGDRNRINVVGSAEWRPNDDLSVYVDGIFGRRMNNLTYRDFAWVGRNGASIPLNMTVDRTDCSNGCVVTGGTFANAQFFLEYRPFIETTTYAGVNPGVNWNINDKLKFELQGNYLRSTFHRESPSVLVVTPGSSGTTVTYANDGTIPVISGNVDINNPANFVWAGGRVNIQDERRLNVNKGLRGSLSWEHSEGLSLKFGGAYDDVSRRITGYDNSQAWQNAVCGGNPSVNIPSPNSQPPCQGLSAAQITPGVGGYPAYPGYGTGSTRGATGGVTYAGSLIPTSSLINYLTAGPNGYIDVNWTKFAADSSYKQYHDNAPESGGTNTGASGGYIRERSPSVYLKANGKVDFFGSDLRYDVGMRYVHTQQIISGRVSLPDPRNAAVGAPLDGGRYPNVVNYVTTENSYSNWLPAASFALNLGEKALARFSVSRTMTRPDPNAQLPGVGFSSPSADLATIGNPALKPYLSTNFDLGFEYYTGREGLISMAAFRKALTGFTVNGTVSVPFTSLAAYGITYDTLTPTQQAAINSRGGPSAASVQVTQQVNASGTLFINGLEFQLVQPLDFLTSRIGITGLGINANATIVDQKSSGAAPATALGVAPYTYNITLYYNHGGIDMRLSNTFTKGSQASNPGQNGITNAAIFSNDYQQWDFSSIIDLATIFDRPSLPQVTFDVVNITDSRLRTYFQFPNAVNSYYRPGRQFMIGVRGSF